MLEISVNCLELDVEEINDMTVQILNDSNNFYTSYGHVALPRFVNGGESLFADSWRDVSDKKVLV